jgi:hypothetical protein
MKHNLLSGLVHFDKSVVAPLPFDGLAAHASVPAASVDAVIAELPLEQLAVCQVQHPVPVLVVVVKLS